MYEAINISDR